MSDRLQVDPRGNIELCRLIIHNPEAYSAQSVRHAAVWILGFLGATAEEIEIASGLVVDAEGLS